MELAIILILSLAGLVHGQCLTDWQPYNDSCYYLHSQDKHNWTESAEFCETHYAHLAYVDDASENAFIKGMIVQRLEGVYESRANVWMGATDEFKEGTWQWAGTKQEATFFDWGPDEPNSVRLNLVEDCLAYWQGYHWEWADLGCQRKCFFVCERPDIGAGLIG